jgi:hypothetical protein
MAKPGWRGGPAKNVAAIRWDDRHKSSSDIID